MEQTDASGNPQRFQIKFAKENGEVREYKNCVLTSFHSSGTTLNVLPENEPHPRTIRRITIIEVSWVAENLTFFYVSKIRYSGNVKNAVLLLSRICPGK